MPFSLLCKVKTWDGWGGHCVSASEPTMVVVTEPIPGVCKRSSRQSRMCYVMLRPTSGRMTSYVKPTFPKLKFWKCIRTFVIAKIATARDHHVVFNCWARPNVTVTWWLYDNVVLQIHASYACWTLARSVKFARWRDAMLRRVFVAAVTGLSTAGLGFCKTPLCAI